MTVSERKQCAAQIVNEAVLRIDKEADRKILKPQWRKDLREAIEAALLRSAQEGMPKKGRKMKALAAAA